jgi:hypothetical protein
MNEKYLKIINERQLVSVMNKTKWRELCHDFEKLHSLYISVKYKLISSEEILGFSAVWWNEIYEESSAIEWIDFNPIISKYRGRLVAPKETDMSYEILAILKKHGIKYSMEGSYFRVWGYLNQHTNPVFL